MFPELASFKPHSFTFHVWVIFPSRSKHESPFRTNPHVASMIPTVPPASPLWRTIGFTTVALLLTSVLLWAVCTLHSRRRSQWCHTPLGCSYMISFSVMDVPSSFSVMQLITGAGKIPFDSLGWPCFLFPWWTCFIFNSFLCMSGKKRTLLCLFLSVMI